MEGWVPPLLIGQPAKLHGHIQLHRTPANTWVTSDEWLALVRDEMAQYAWAAAEDRSEFPKFWSRSDAARHHLAAMFKSSEESDTTAPDVMQSEIDRMVDSMLMCIEGYEPLDDA